MTTTESFLPSKLFSVHDLIHQKLDYFYEAKKIPHILFHGPSGSGKHTIVYDFINKIYDNDKEKIKHHVMYVNCSHGKGIKFIREELKFFAKSQIHSHNEKDLFKSIVLLNADKLTTDAQSALRRCIEQFSHSTRFFIVVEDKYMLLKPILSRFCEIHVPNPYVKGQTINLHQYVLQNTYHMSRIHVSRKEWLKNYMNGLIRGELADRDCLEIAELLYNKGYSCLDIIYYIDHHAPESLLLGNKYDFLVTIEKIKKTFRKEKILLYIVLHFLYVDTEDNLLKLYLSDC